MNSYRRSYTTVNYHNISQETRGGHQITMQCMQLCINGDAKAYQLYIQLSKLVYSDHAFCFCIILSHIQLTIGYLNCKLILLAWSYNLSYKIILAIYIYRQLQFMMKTMQLSDYILTSGSVCISYNFVTKVSCVQLLQLKL